ncbi:hypothetical protein HED54_20500 [Ochrobactrum anthropi ATCC 49188]|nr:hypothetical protein [Brucella anthropi ATCC 49188]
MTVDNSAGAVKASGMQFQTDGYEVTGGDLTLVSPASNLSGAPIIRVGGGTNDGDMKATISAKLVGTDGMRKTYAGRLVLTADNQYTGGTDILGGTLQLGDGGTSGSVLGDIDTGIDGINRGLLAVDRSGTVTVDNTITGTESSVLQAVVKSHSRVTTAIAAERMSGLELLSSRKMTIWGLPKAS